MPPVPRKISEEVRARRRHPGGARDARQEQEREAPDVPANQGVVYISCKVTSLARDLAMMQARGYEVVKCVAVDQFCETVHVETVCLLSKVNPKK